MSTDSSTANYTSRSRNARLTAPATVCTWSCSELELEIGGVVIPSDIHARILAPVAAARLAAVEVDARLEHFTARLLKTEAIF